MEESHELFLKFEEDEDVDDAPPCRSLTNQREQTVGSQISTIDAVPITHEGVAIKVEVDIDSWDDSSSNSNITKTQGELVVDQRNEIQLKDYVSHQNISTKATERESLTTGRSLKCKYCQKSYTYETSLNKHLQKCNEISFAVDETSERIDLYKTKDSLQKHSQQHVKKTFECDICNREFGLFDHLKNHLFVTHMEIMCVNETKCRVCEINVKSTYTLRNYTRKTSTGMQHYTCDQCRKELAKKITSNIHLPIQKEKPFNYDIAGKNVTSNNSSQAAERQPESYNVNVRAYIENVTIHHSSQDIDRNSNDKTVLSGRAKSGRTKNESNSQQKITLCRKECSNMGEHLKTHPSLQEGNSHTCTFNNEDDEQTTHISSTHSLKHTRPKPYTDPRPIANSQSNGLIMSVRAKIAEHNLEKSKTSSLDSVLKRQFGLPMKETLYKCSTCEKEFSSKLVLEMHNRSHTGEKPFKCSLCSRSFYYKCTLEKHLHRHHGKPKTKANKAVEDNVQCINKERRFDADGKSIYKCKLCEMDFRDIGEHLMLHIRMQQGDQLFLCIFCEKGFTLIEHLKRHLTLYHKGTTKYKCETCGKTYAWKTGLNRHRLTHAREKPFQCGICGQAFNRYHLLEKHLSVHSI